MDEKQLYRQLIGTYLHNKRKEKGLTQEELIKDVDISDKFIGRIERGKQLPSSYTTYKLIDELDIDPKAMFDFIKANMTNNEPRD